MAEWKENNNGLYAIATLGGGCFWCLEAVFEKITGILKVEPGYTGGQTTQPNYQEVCGGKTGHAEAIQLTYDPQFISYKEILEIFFTVHDPTTLNRQGADRGTQYRSVIFYHNQEQLKIASQLIMELTEANSWGAPLVTALEPAVRFYPAESYHHGYYRSHPEQPYCQAVINPKIEKLRKVYYQKLKPD